MIRRTWEKTGIQTSLLGFGCMRFPTRPDGKIDEERAEKMLDEAIAAGVNYIDTAYPYHNGESAEQIRQEFLLSGDKTAFVGGELPGGRVKDFCRTAGATAHGLLRFLFASRSEQGKMGVHERAGGGGLLRAAEGGRQDQKLRSFFPR